MLGRQRVSRSTNGTTNGCWCSCTHDGTLSSRSALVSGHSAACGTCERQFTLVAVSSNWAMASNGTTRCSSSTSSPKRSPPAGCDRIASASRISDS
jgi:hypothetical protein